VLLRLDMRGKRLVRLDARNALEHGRFERDLVEIIAEDLDGRFLDLIGIEEATCHLLADVLAHILDERGGAAIRHEMASNDDGVRLSEPDAIFSTANVEIKVSDRPGLTPLHAPIAFFRFSSILSRKPVVESHFCWSPTSSARSLVM
jgi:hypothetical protein